MDEGEAGRPVEDLPRADAPDPVLEAFRAGVDRSLLRENLRRTPQERLEGLVRFLAGIAELRRAEDRRRTKGP